jgi:hypothetical protein
MSLTPATQALLALPYRLLRTSLGRRAAAAMLVSVTLATTVQTLYANADGPGLPAAAAGQAGSETGSASRGGDATTAAGLAGAAGAKPAKPKQAAGSDGSGKPADAGDRGKAEPARERGGSAPSAAAAADEPGKVAVAWYARKLGIPASKVRLLQQRRTGDNEVRALVLAEVGKRLDTAEVKVRRTKTGWKVP